MRARTIGEFLWTFGSWVESKGVDAVTEKWSIQTRFRRSARRFECLWPSLVPFGAILVAGIIKSILGLLDHTQTLNQKIIEFEGITVL